MVTTVGRLIVFEGPDGVGKTSLSVALKNHFASKEIPCELLSFPGKEDGTLGKLVYDVHHKMDQFGIKSIDPTSLQLLHVAAHIDCIEKKILPGLRMGKQIILDRYWWSTVVYGRLSNCNQNSIQRMIEAERTHWGATKPHVVFLIRRILSDAENGSRSLLVSGYQEVAAVEMNNYPVSTIDNNGRIEESGANIIAKLDEISK